MNNGKYLISGRSRAAAAAVFAAYFAALLRILIFRDTPSCAAGVNLTPFASVMLYASAAGSGGARAIWQFILNIAGNVLIMVPFGFLLPWMLPRLRSAFFTASAACIFSVCVEVTQLITGMGSCDIDDVILNTLGGLLGFAAFALICRAAGHAAARTGAARTG
jgi:glycopeptide antibiotics resistance protein